MRSQIISKIGNPDISPDVIISHIRRRGEIGGSAKKVGKRIKELERLYGIREGSAGGNGSNQYKKKELEPNNSVEAKSQSDLAAQMGISVDTLQNYKILAEFFGILLNMRKSSGKIFLLIQSRCFAGFEFNICQNNSFTQLPANLPNLTIS